MELLDKYKTAWKNESSFTGSMLSDKEIKTYLSNRSAHTDRMYRIGIMFDMVLKGLLAIAVAGVVLVYPASQGTWIVSAVLGVVLLASFLFERKVYLQIPDISPLEASTRDMLRERISFFNRSYLKALLIIAISSPVMILTGGLYYFYFKYGELRPLDLEDMVVFSIFLFAGYIFSVYFQVRNYRFHINQLESLLSELDEGVITADMLKLQRRKRQRIIIMTSLAIVSGILLLLLLLIEQSPA